MLYLAYEPSRYLSTGNGSVNSKLTNWCREVLHESTPVLSAVINHDVLRCTVRFRQSAMACGVMKSFTLSYCNYTSAVEGLNSIIADTKGKLFRFPKNMRKFKSCI